MGSPAKAKQVVGNLNTIVSFRVRTVETAEQLTAGLPEVDVAALTAVSGVTDATGSEVGVDFVSRNEDRIATQSVPLISPSDVMALPKGHAFALIEGNQLWKLRVPLLDPVGDEHLPSSIAELAEAMRRKYRTGDQWWLAPEAQAANEDRSGTWSASETEVAATATPNEAADMERAA
jgi:hypothetical protein